MFARVMSRFQTHWIPLVLVGLIGALVMQLPGLILVPALALVGLGAAAAAMSDPTALVSALSTGSGLAVLAAGVLLVVVVMLVVSLVVDAFAMAAMLAAVRTVNRGEQPDVAGALQEGMRQFPRMLLYMLLAGLTGIAVGLINIIPILGQLVFLLALLLLFPAFGYFGSYAISNGASVGGAYSLAWRSITRRLGDTALAGLMLFAMAVLLVMGNAVAAQLGVLAWILNVGLTALYLAFSSLLLTHFYEERIEGKVG